MVLLNNCARSFQAKYVNTILISHRGRLSTYIASAEKISDDHHITTIPISKLHVAVTSIKKFESVYHEQLRASHVTQKAQFEYAWCLVRSKYSADIRKGILLLEDLYNNYDTEKRDCLYYLAIGNARIKEYSKALSYVRSFLQIEPANVQVQQLETLIKKKMEKEGLVGMAVAGGVIIGIASILGLGIAMAKKN